ncbi:MAG: DUF1292 domain-containing protein [Clostridiales bacterium]|nr:DUF1292 domain-containing protein [Clostridiales bacterium]
MKTNQKNGFIKNLLGLKDRSPLISRKKTGEEDELIVINDVSTNKNYYLSVIDDFFYKEKEYIVMSNYTPDNGEHADPELVIMETKFNDKGSQIFISIRDENELEVAFSLFMRRYYDSDVPGRQRRVGVSRPS